MHNLSCKLKHVLPQVLNFDGPNLIEDEEKFVQDVSSLISIDKQLAKVQPKPSLLLTETNLLSLINTCVEKSIINTSDREALIDLPKSADQSADVSKDSINPAFQMLIGDFCQESINDIFGDEKSEFGSDATRISKKLHLNLGDFFSY